MPSNGGPWTPARRAKAADMMHERWLQGHGGRKFTGGTKVRHDGRRFISVLLDEDMISDVVGHMQKHSSHSFSEALRTLVQWGLDSDV